MAAAFQVVEILFISFGQTPKEIEHQKQ